ncbi:V-type ATP synthase subunit D [bacterium]|nr:V-type ATP synthase subunit D [bacterium]
MQIKINPTRMALLGLRKRFVVARRGHKLLKDKLEGLLQAFMPIVEEYGRLRKQVDRELPATLHLFILAGASSDEKAIEAALDEYETRLDMDIAKKIIMSVPMPELTLKGFDIRNTYSTVSTKADFDRASNSLRALFPLLLKLANLEEAVLRMAQEIEKTRRRVNALEYVLIPTLGSAIKSISNKLEENDRADRARLMKIKDMLSMGEMG